MASDLTFYFAWVDQTDNTWSSAFARSDEKVFNIEIACEEGQIPKLTIEIINPRIGLIAPGRLYWAWLSYSSAGGEAVPLFFGRLVGIPQTILFNTIKCEFISRAPDYIQQKQLVAESLKVSPNYDPVFFDVQKRDDLDAILEGWSSIYAIDRVSGEVSASDILVGEDGILTIPYSDTFYDSVQMTLMQSPLVAVNVKAEVTWEQQYTGYFFIGQWAYPTLGNEPFVGDWPKSGASLGGGYSGAVAWAGIRDPFVQILTSSNWDFTYHWQNTARHHEEGDTMSIDIALSVPTQPMSLFTTYSFSQNGVVAPDTVDPDGYPDPTNIPEIQVYQAVGVRTFALDYAGLEALGVLGLRYDANRKRSEQIEITVQADVQPILIDPLVTEDTETITLKSGDLALPLIDFLNWSSIAGQAVAQGQIIFPDNPLVAGQTSSQIAVTGGTAGTVEPTFSNIAGVTTNDGSVVWSSMGPTPPTEMAQDWTQLAPVSLGTLVIPKPISGAPDRTSYLAPGNLSTPPTGMPTAKYTIIAENMGTPGDTMMECIKAGIFGGSQTDPHFIAQFTTFINPSGQNLHICIQAGLTGEFHPTFDETTGGQTTDGTVIWQCLGTVSVPIGGWPGMTPAASYFPSDRGQQSLQHMICRARAKLRRRARAVQVAFECWFEAAASISCRMSVAITDPRLPGGGATGKVVSYKLLRDGDSGETKAQIVIGCTIGKEDGFIGLPSPLPSPPAPGGGGELPSPPPGSIIGGGGGGIGPSGPNGGAGGGPVNPIDGTPVYVDGVFNPGEVEVWAGSTIPVPTTSGNSAPAMMALASGGLGNDIGYTPPVQQTVDDGISFPLNGVGDVILENQWHGIASTINPQNIADYNAQVKAAITAAIQGASSHPLGGISIGGTASGSVSGDVSNAASLAADLTTHINQAVYQGSGLWYELSLKNLQGGPYAAAYVIQTTLLALPMTLNLSAPSS